MQAGGTKAAGSSPRTSTFGLADIGRVDRGTAQRQECRAHRPRKGLDHRGLAAARRAIQQDAARWSQPKPRKRLAVLQRPLDRSPQRLRAGRPEAVHRRRRATLAVRRCAPRASIPLPPWIHICRTSFASACPPMSSHDTERSSASTVSRCVDGVSCACAHTKSSMPAKVRPLDMARPLARRVASRQRAARSATT